MADELVICPEPAVLEAAMRSLYPDPDPDPVEFAIKAKTIRFMAEFTEADEAKPDPGTRTLRRSGSLRTSAAGAGLSAMGVRRPVDLIAGREWGRRG